MNQDPFRVPHKHRRHFSVMVNMPDCCASDLGSIPGQVCQFLKIFFLLNSSNSTRIMEKLEYSTGDNFSVELFSSSLCKLLLAMLSMLAERVCAGFGKKAKF